MTGQRTHHVAIVTTAVRAPLELIEVPTVDPADNEVLVKVEYVASTPLDLHQNDSGLLVKHPQILGGNIAGTVVTTGTNVLRLKEGDEVFGFGWREQKEKAYQEFATFPEYLLGKVPLGIKLQEAVTLPDNFVTVFHSVTTDLGLPLPWPRPSDQVPQHANDPILIWGGSSSVGTFAIQIFRYYGYNNLIAVASQKHHEYLKSLGARLTYDYHEQDVVEQILGNFRSSPSTSPMSAVIPFILDCIGSKKLSIAPVAQVAQKGARVAVLLPVIIRDSSDTTAPEYSMDPESEANWAEGVVVEGVRTHFYLENHFHKTYLQSTIMPTLLGQGAVRPNRQRIVEGGTMLERAQKALDALRRKEASAERLVWRIPDGEN